MPSVKIVNRSVHLFSTEEVSCRLKGLRLRIGGMTVALTTPFDIYYPLGSGARSPDSLTILKGRGSCNDTLALQRAVN